MGTRWRSGDFSLELQLLFPGRPPDGAVWARRVNATLLRNGLTVAAEGLLRNFSVRHIKPRVRGQSKTSSG